MGSSPTQPSFFFGWLGFISFVVRVGVTTSAQQKILIAGHNTTADPPEVFEQFLIFVFDTGIE